jgi:succinate dehydrogenase / fumarate reductase flavoprotein subunit
MALDSKFQMVRFRTNGQIIKNHINLVNPNKRNLDVIVVGTGLAGGSASATLAELDIT